MIISHSTGAKVPKGFIPLPSGILISRERKYLGKSWDECHKLLSSTGYRMPTIPEFLELLKYSKEHEEELFEEITAVRRPWRAEQLDAYFEKRPDGMYVLTGNKTHSEKLLPYLAESKLPGISLDSWLDNHTAQGLPTEECLTGELYYLTPENGRVARFYANPWGAGFYADGLSYFGDSHRGVRLVMRGAPRKAA